MSARAADIAAFLGAPLEGAAGTLAGVATLRQPRPGHLLFAKKLSVEQAAALGRVEGCVVIVGPDAPFSLPFAHIRCAHPRLAFAKAVQRFFALPAMPGIHPTAQIHPSAQVGADCVIGAYTVIGADSVIGDGVNIRHHVIIGPRVQIGAHAFIKSSSVIGEEGFGIVRDDETGDNLRVPHIGGVVIHEHVEIGALNTVCSGTVEPTVIHHHVKTDDHVHIAHNCVIGNNCIITACAELSGSVTIGERTWLGPNCSIMNGISIGADSVVGLGAVVTKSLPDKVVAAGVPARILRANEAG